jgi:hypothetical protein
MTRLYVLGEHASPPSPWTNETGYSTKYIRMCGTPGETTNLGGQSTHTHTIASSSVGYSDGSIGTANYGATWWFCAHNNHSVSATFSSVNNTPAYYDYALWSTELTQWETSERRFPAGAVVLSDATISDDELARATSADGKLIRIGTPGGSGGDADGLHNHSVSSGSLSSIDSSTQSPAYIDMYPPSKPPSGHSHTFSGSSSNATLLPARVQTRLYRAASQTTKAKAGVICFVDGTTSGNWVAVSWAGNCIESVNSNATITGADTHNQTYSGTSSSFTQGSTVGISYLLPGPGACADPHSHSVSITSSTESHVPPYVSLYPVKLVNTLYRLTKAVSITGC